MAKVARYKKSEREHSFSCYFHYLPGGTWPPASCARSLLLHLYHSLSPSTVHGCVLVHALTGMVFSAHPRIKQQMIALFFLPVAFSSRFHMALVYGGEQ